MDMDCAIFMKQSNDGRHSVDSINDNTLSLEPQEDDSEVDNPTMPRVEKQTWTKNADMLHSEPDGGPKIIWTRSGWVSCRPQRLGITEEQYQKDTYLPIGMCLVSIPGSMTLKCWLQNRICGCDMRKWTMENDSDMVAGGHHYACSLPPLPDVFQTFSDVPEG